MLKLEKLSYEYSLPSYSDNTVANIKDIIQSLQTEQDLFTSTNIDERTYLVPQLDTYNLAQEGFVTNLFVGIINTILHLVNNIKTVMFKSFKDLKRTELVFYHESNALTLKRILRVPYESIKDLEIDIPQGLQTTYKHACSTGISHVELMNMKNRSVSFKTKISEIVNAIVKEEPVDFASGTMIDDLPAVKKSFLNFLKCFKSKAPTVKVTFNKVFEKDDLVHVDEQLLVASKYLEEVSSIHDDMNECSRLIKIVIDRATSIENTVNKKDLFSLHKLTLVLATMFEMYGTVIQDIFRLEHNFVHVLKSIRKHMGY